MNTRPWRILTLAAVVAWQGAGVSRAQQLAPPAAPGPAVAGLEQFQTSAAPQAIPVAYRQPAEAAVPGHMPNPVVTPQYAPQGGPAYSGPIYEGGHAAPSYAPEHGGVHYHGVEYVGGGYGGTPTMQPYWAQTPPDSYINQVDDSQYFDPYQPDEHGIAAGAPLGEHVFDPIYPAGHCYGYTRGEVFVLSRDMKSNQPFTRMGPNGPIVLSASDLDLEYEGGIRAAAGVPLSSCVILEASYFGLQEWDSSAAVTDPMAFLFSVYAPSANFVVDGRQVADFFGGTRLQAIDFHSEMHNAELNLMYRVPIRSCKQEAWLIAGARYVKIQERLDYVTESGPADNALLIRTSLTNVQTDNDMVGGQLGGLLHHHVSKKLRLSLDAKAAMMVNFTEERSNVTTNLFPLGGERLTDDSLALVTDAGAALTFDVNCWFSITGGYRVMYVDGVALAPNNFNPVLPGSGLRQPRLDDNGSILYHGATLGGEIRW